MKCNDKSKIIKLRQGDTCNIKFSGLPFDKSYTFYWAVYDLETKKTIGQELGFKGNLRSSIVLGLSAQFTNQLKVGKGEDYSTYGGGLKMCSNDGTELTLDLWTVIVEPRCIEGDINE